MPVYSRLLLLGFIYTAAAFAVEPPSVPAKPNSEHKADKQVTGHVFILEKRPPPPLDQLKVPAGFRIERVRDSWRASNASLARDRLPEDRREMLARKRLHQIAGSDS